MNSTAKPLLSTAEARVYELEMLVQEIEVAKDIQQIRTLMCRLAHVMLEAERMNCASEYFLSA
jgi:hypothetical protein